MITRAIKTLVGAVVGALGFDLRRRQVASADGRHARDSLIGLLQQVGSVGFRPVTVLDVGAARGTFTAACRQVFPEARYVLIEPLEEYLGELEAVAAGGGAEIVKAAACSRSGPVSINVHVDLVGSSLYREQEAAGVDGEPRRVLGITLDDLRNEKGLAGPYLIKLDVQGAELDVLEGAKTVLAETEYILAEVSLFQFFEGGPQLFDVVAYMKAHGFVAYDLCGLHYRLLDHALAQVDLAFCREEGPLRKHQTYASPDQRDEQNKRYQAKNKALLRGRP